MYPTTYHRKVILDFDGLLTDLEDEAQPVIDVFTNNLKEHLGLDETAMAVELKLSEQQLGTDDSWYYNGQPTARWDADPYIKISTQADRIYERARPEVPADERSKQLTTLFRDAQASQQRPRWRDGAADLLERLQADTNPAVLTNSDTDEVKKKLAQIGHEDLPVFGNAKKYVLSNTPTIKRHGPREIRLDRPQYQQTLETLAQEHGFTPENTVVAGDIYELDLALPHHLGYATILAWPHGNAQADINAVNNHPRGRVLDNYTDILWETMSL